MLYTSPDPARARARGQAGCAAVLGHDAQDLHLAPDGHVLTVRRRRERGESPEATTAWIYMLAASVPALMLSANPHGLEEVHRLLFSTLLGATSSDVVWLGGAACEHPTTRVAMATISLYICDAVGDAGRCFSITGESVCAAGWEAKAPQGIF